MYVPLKEGCKITGDENSWLKRKCINGKFKTAKKVGSMWFIDDRELRGEEISDEDILPFDFVTIPEYSRINGCSPAAVRLRIKKGLYPEAMLVGKTWFIPKDAKFVESLKGNKLDVDFSDIDKYATYNEGLNTPVKKW